MANAYRVGFCLSGGGALFRAAVGHAGQLGVDIAAVFAAPRDGEIHRPYCEVHGIPMWQIESADRRAFDDELTLRCSEAALDLVVLTFNRIIPPALVERYRGRIVNMHPGLLPSLPGAHPLENALKAGARFVGATMHEVDELVDHGPVIAQCVLPLARNDELESIRWKLYQIVQPMFLQTIAWFAEGRIEKDEAGRIWVRGARYGTFPTSPEIERPEFTIVPR